MGEKTFNGTEESFEALLENSMSGVNNLKPGELIETTIVSISDTTVFLQLSGKSEGVMDAAELTDKEGNITVKEGDTISAYFLNAQHGEMHFTTRISGDKAAKDILENAYANGIPVEGTVEKEIKGGFEVKLGSSRAFCPYSQMGMKRVEDASVYVGKHLTFKIMEYREKGRNILVSNRAILQEERSTQIEVLKKTLSKGMKVKGTVRSLQSFGAFVDIDGIQALLPVSEISRSRVDDISKFLTAGDEIEAVIINLDWQKERISLSMKQLISDPWDDAENKYEKGSKHKGKVVQITKFGAFVSLEPGFDGLIHSSELEGDSREKRSELVLKKGQTVDVQILNIDFDKRRMSLKPVSENEAENDYKDYMDSDSETYNPFAQLLKDRKKNKA